MTRFAMLRFTAGNRELAALHGTAYHVPLIPRFASMTKLINRYLGSGDALARLRDHAARLVRLQNVLAQHLPPALAAACSVANLKNGALVLLADGGAVAARLKQMAPTLMQQFAATGVPVTAIQVKVKVIEAREQARPVTARSISASSAQNLEDFSATLPADAPLREALERLIARSRRNGAD